MAETITVRVAFSAVSVLGLDVKMAEFIGPAIAERITVKPHGTRYVVVSGTPDDLKMLADGCSGLYSWAHATAARSGRLIALRINKAIALARASHTPTEETV